jgi:hypothetical protein
MLREGKAKVEKKKGMKGAGMQSEEEWKGE